MKRPQQGKWIHLTVVYGIGCPDNRISQFHLRQQLLNGYAIQHLAVIIIRSRFTSNFFN